jgi:20S proteasome subunit alpha 6
MDAWCGHTMVGQPKERRRFVRQHMSNIDHILEILLRLVRGERATAGGAGGQQQTHVSLAVLAIFRVATDYGARAGVERRVVEERVSEIVRCLPTHLIYKSLDGMFREWAFAQKKGDKASNKA